MTFADLLMRFAAELALFSAVTFVLFAVNDLVVDAIYFVRRLWRSATVYRRFPRAFGRTLADRGGEQRFVAIFVPAWDESTVIASMLRATLVRLEYADYRIFKWSVSTDGTCLSTGHSTFTRPVYQEFLRRFRHVGRISARSSIAWTPGRAYRCGFATISARTLDYRQRLVGNARASVGSDAHPGRGFRWTSISRSPNMSVNALLIIALGFLVGLLSGMFGVGGGFLTTPLLIFYGIPPTVAVASARRRRSPAPAFRA
jgi:hypothetical protein